MKKLLQFTWLLFFVFFQATLSAQCLSGTYTIGGSNPNFATFKNATDALETRGVCGPVTFKVADGNYYEAIVIPKANGVSMSNPITFEGLSKDSSRVSISSTYESCLTIKSDYVNIRSLGFRSQSTGTSFGTAAIELGDSIKSTVISNCDFYVNSHIAAIRRTIAVLDPNLHIANNNFVSMSQDYGIQLLSSLFFTEHWGNVHIEFNHFKDFGRTLALTNSGSVNISGNWIENESWAGIGMFLDWSNGFEIRKNKFTGKFHNAIGIGGFTSNVYTRLITNNIISGELESGISIGGATGCTVLFNTINNTKKNEGTCMGLGDTDNNEIQNNLFSATGYTQMIVTSNSAGNIFDHNNYYTLSDTVFSVGSVTYNFTQWKQLNGRDANSWNFKPQFISESNLHLNDYNINNKGIASIVNDDFDGEARDAIPDIGADEFFLQPLATDAGLSIYDTTFDYCSGSVRPILAKLYNNGTVTMSDATINWQINNTAQTPYNLAGTIAPGKFKFIQLGTINSQYGGEKIKASISVVNGVADQNKTNDSINFINARVYLSGTYKVGGSGADFSSVKEAMGYIRVAGICGPVTFNIRKGTYTGSVIVDSIRGASAANSLTLQSETANRDDVQIVNESNIENAVTLEKVNYLRFKNLTIKSATSHPLENVGDCNYLSFENVHFKGVSIYSVYGNCQYVFNNCLFECALSLGQSGGRPNKGITVTNCVFSYSSGITLNGVDSITVSKNRFIWPIYNSPFNFYPAVFLYKCNDATISKNYIEGEFTHGIRITESGTNGTINVSNNLIVGASVTTYLLGCDNSRNVNFVYNTSIGRTPILSSNPFVSTEYNSNIKVLNNVFVSQNLGPALFYSDGNNGITESEHNLYFNKDTYQVYYLSIKTSFADYLSKTSLDKTSFFKDPMFVSDSVFRIGNDSIRGQAISIAAITDDLEGNSRDASKPTAGAFELAPEPVHQNKLKDIAVVAVSDTAWNIGDNSVSLIVKNKGAKNANPYILNDASIDSLDLSYRVNEGPWITEKWIGKLAATETLTYQFTSPVNVPKGAIFKLTVKAKVRGNYTDVNLVNDTLLIRATAPMSGVYYVGGTGNPDFADPTEAMAALKICHASGPVEFRLHEGTYDLLNIEGDDTVTITDEFGGGLLRVYLNCDRIHASNLTLEHLIIQTPEQPVGPVYEEMGLEIITHKLTIRGCLVNGRNASKVNGLCFVNSSNVMLNEVSFYNLNTAIIYNCKKDAGAASTTWTGKHEISHCWFTNNKKAFAIYDQSSGANYDMTPPDSILFHHNTIREGIGNTGIVINKEKVFIKIYNNSVKAKPALEIANVKTTIPIYNNYLSHFAKDTLLEPAVKFINTANHSFIYNSVWGQLSLESANNLLFRNNSLYDQFQPAFAMDDQSTLNSDYNNLYSNSPVLATLKNTTTGNIQEFPSLDSLKTVTNREQHSISYNPYYQSDDMHSNSGYLKNKAIPFGLITTDFDDKPRNSIAPDIGASEIVLLNETVWPGDADDDSRVTMKDLLSIGLYNGITGMDRFPNIIWAAHSVDDWAQSQYNTANMKHADCNGDGVVDGNDTLAIIQNFNLTRYTNYYREMAETPSQGFDLHFVMPFHKPVYTAGEKIYVEVWLGKPFAYVYDTYGIAFDIGIDANCIQPGSFEFRMTEGWLGRPNATAFSLTRTDEKTGTGNAGFVRNDHQNTTGYGKIGYFSFIYNGNTSPQGLPLKFNNVLLVNANGLKQTVKAQNNSATNYKSDVVTSITDPVSQAEILYAFPNPLSEETVINYTLETEEVVHLEIFNSLGERMQLLLEEKQNKGLHSVQFNAKQMGCISGVFIARLRKGNRNSFIKLIVD
jgi:hypothetical protein